MNIGRIIAALLLTLAIGGCSNYEQMLMQDQFDKTTKEYNRMLRWDDLEAAGMNFADTSIRPDYLTRAEAAKGVKITEYRVKYTDYDPLRGEAKIKVEIDYYIPPSPVLKTLVDNQRWAYKGPESDKSWRLMSLLPEFK